MYIIILVFTFSIQFVHSNSLDMYVCTTYVCTYYYTIYVNGEMKVFMYKNVSISYAFWLHTYMYMYCIYPPGLKLGRVNPHIQVK